MDGLRAVHSSPRGRGQLLELDMGWEQVYFMIWIFFTQEDVLWLVLSV